MLLLGVEEEIVFHEIWDCTIARDVWGGSIHKFQKASGRGSELRQIFEGLHVQCDSQEMDIFAVIARRIWLRRNLMDHENSFIHPNKVVGCTLGLPNIH